MSNILQKLSLALTSVKITDKLFFIKNLYLMIKSSISLADALDSLVLQTSNQKFKLVLQDIAARIRQGESFSSSLALHPEVFPEIFVNMIKAGEESGKLEEVLVTLGEQLYKDHDLQSKVRGALAYPIVILVAMISITTGLVIFVIPKLTAMFVEANMALPLPTRILIASSNFMIHYSYIIIVVVVVAAVFFIRFRRTVTGKHVLHKILLRIPVIGKLVMKVNLARMSRTLSSLLKTDIPVVRSFTITSNVLANIYYQEALKACAEELKTGESIHSALAKFQQLFPVTILQMVAVGEQTGNLDVILTEIARFYEEDLDNNLKNLPSLLEPFLILMLGVVVGGVAIAIMLPIYSLSSGAA